jgi:hypothetical protein
MHTNIGTIDRTIRILAGLALIATVFVGPQNALGWIGVIPLVTALIGWCPAYTVIDRPDEAIPDRINGAI